MFIGTATGPPRQGNKRPERQDKTGGESAAFWCLLTTPSAWERQMSSLHAKGKDKGRLSREQEDGFLLLPLAVVVQWKAEGCT